MPSAWFTMSEGQTTDAILAAKRFAAKEAALDALIAAGPGGGSLIHQAPPLTLDDEQFKALPTTGRQVVAAPGVGKIIVPVSGWATLNAAAGGYTTAAGASLVLGWLIGEGNLDYASTLIIGFGSGTTFRSAPFGFPALSPFVEGDFSGANAIVALGNDRTNKPLYIKDDFGGVADYTGGNPANTLVISVAYMVLDQATGEYE